MATVTLRIEVIPVERVVRLFNRIQVWRSTEQDANGDNVNFTELTTPATRIPIVETVASYDFIDDAAPATQAGRDRTRYQVRYENTVNGNLTSFSRAVEGVLNPALDVLSVQDLKTNFLFGIDLTDDAGVPYPDSLFAFYIQAAVAQVEMEFDIIVKPTVIEAEAHDFIKRDYDKYVFTVLDFRPIVSVERVELVLPTEVRVIDYDPNSFQVDFNAGTLEIVPGSGQITLGQTGAFLPLVFGGQDYLPRTIRVWYTAGISDRTVRGRHGVPANLVEYIGMLASEGPLGIAGDLIVGAGIASQSISMDGLSQSVNTTSSATNSGYGARIQQFQKRRKELKSAIKAAFSMAGPMVVA